MRRDALLIVFVTALFTALTAASPAFADEGDYAGDATCLECHEEIGEQFAKRIHGIKADPRTPAAKYDEYVCESCHGPGLTHAEEGEGGDILALNARSELPAEKKNNVCLQCHAKGKVVFWHKSEHQIRGLSCADCHNVHGGHPNYLSNSSQPDVCASCHRNVTPQLLRQSHHPIREGKMTCSDCHNTHGTIADGLIDAQYINLKCFECHAKTRGPYLWEHPAAVENCLSCHRPHGSNYNNLLNAKVPFLCQRCHSNSGHASTLQARTTANAGQPVYRALNNRGFYKACVNCHIAVHGSNHPSGKSLLR